MHANSKLIFEKYAKKYFSKDSKVLEIGPDLFPSSYQVAVKEEFSSWETIDIAHYDKLTYIMKSEYEFAI